MSRLNTGLSAVRTVMSVRLAPLLLLTYVIVWPLAGFPWWPLIFVLALGIVLRILGFGYLIQGKRGPVLLVSLLLVTTLFAWSPWAAATSVGIAIAVVGAFRLPRWQLLAVGAALALVAGTGWVVDTIVAERRAAASYEETRAFTRAQLLPRYPRGALGALMGTVADGDPRGACALLSDDAERQLAQAWRAPDCAGAVMAWHARITRPGDYTTTNDLKGVVSIESPDKETATVTACDLRWSDFLIGSLPDAGPRSPGQLQLQLRLRTGYEIVGYRPC